MSSLACEAIRAIVAMSEGDPVELLRCVTSVRAVAAIAESEEQKR